jgi:hypothetical protein
MNRRDLFKFIAGAAALPIVAKLPAPLRKVVERAGAWATVQVTSGVITSITITHGGSGYNAPPKVIIGGDTVQIEPPK